MTSSSVLHPRHEQPVDEVAAAIRRRIADRSPDVTVTRAPAPAATVPVVVDGSAPARRPTVVAAAVDDDGNPERILTFAAAKARELGVPLRVVHVWTGDGSPGGVRMCRHDRISDADRLLTTILYDHLPPEEAAEAEREIVHDADPVHALAQVSAQAALLVVAARSDPAGGGPLGDTVRELVGRTACPLAVLPCRYDPGECARPCAW